MHRPSLAALLLVVLPLAAAAQAPGGEPVLCPPEAHPKAPVYRDAELSAAFQRRDYDRVEAIFDDLQKASKAPGIHVGRFAGYQLMLLALEPLDALDAWVASKPRSSRALAVRAEARVRWAWAARGTGWGRDVPESAWATFRERLELALADVERAMTLDPKNAAAPAVGVTVAMGLNLGRAKADAYLVAAEAADPTEIIAHQRMLTFLRPRWHGQPGEALAFARQAAAAKGAETNRLDLVVDAHAHAAEDGGGRPHLLRREVHEELTAAHARLVEAYPRSSYLATRAAMFHLAANAPERAVPLLERGVELQDPSAYVALGQLLEYGRGVPRDEVRSVRLYCQAAHAGHPEGQAELAEVLLTGHAGVPKDLGAALRWAELAADHSVHGQFVLGWTKCLRSPAGHPDHVDGEAQVERAASSGDVEAKAVLGGLLIHRRQRQLRRGCNLLLEARRDGSRRAHLEIALAAVLGAMTGTPTEIADSFRAALQLGERDAARPLASYLRDHPELRRPGDPE